MPKPQDTLVNRQNPRLYRLSRLAMLSASALAFPALAVAQQTGGQQASATQAGGQVDTGDDDAPAARGGRGSEIVVYGDRIKGSVQAPQAPVTSFTAQDIQAYGVDSITDLLAAIAPEVNSGRGRGASMPVILVNGMRIASFRELRDYPPEAIRRVEVLPEEVALKYGYSPDQRVVNFILKNHFRSRALEVQGSEPTRGGADTEKVEAQMLRINRSHRFNVALKADRTSLLTEADRGVAQAPGSEPSVASDPDPAAARSLVASARDYSANVNWTVPVGHGVAPGSLTLNAAASRSDATGLSGLNSVELVAPAGGGSALRTLPGALTRFTRTDTLQSGASLNKPVGFWQLAVTLDGTHTDAITDTANRADTTNLVAEAAGGTLPIDGPLPGLPSAGFTHANAISNSVTSLVTLIGHPLRLPGGQTALTLKAGFAWSGQSGSTSQTGAPLVPSLRRGDASAGVNLAVPITSRRESFGAGLGDITLNLSLGGDQLSDYGQLVNWSAGLTWGVTPKLSLQGSYIANQVAPSFGNLGNPQVTAFNVPVFDFTTGQTALVAVTTGGNPALLREGLHDIKLGTNWTLPFLSNSNLIAEYFDNRSSNVSSGFPLLTPAIEAAFPGRVTRGGNGEITAIDERPVNLASQHETRLRWGFNLFGNLGAPMAPGAGRFGGMFGGGDGGRPGGDRPGGYGGAGGGRGPGGGPGGGGPGGGGSGGGRGPMYPGRWNLAIYHTVQFIDRVQVAAGGPTLNLLNGDALGSGGGVARQGVELDSGFFYKGLGLRLGGTWAAPTHVNAATSDLRFGALAKFNLRAFVDFSQRPKAVKAVPFLKGARFQLMVNNLLDSRQKVTDATGATPLAYQPDVLDPLGRVIGAELRKTF